MQSLCVLSSSEFATALRIMEGLSVWWFAGLLTDLKIKLLKKDLTNGLSGR